MDATHLAAALPARTEETLLDKFNTYFEVIAAVTEGQIQSSQRLRYQVYCVENPFENTAGHPDGLERDEFEVDPLLRQVEKEQRPVWEVLTDGGMLVRRPQLAA